MDAFVGFSKKLRSTLQAEIAAADLLYAASLDNRGFDAALDDYLADVLESYLAALTNWAYDEEDGAAHRSLGLINRARLFMRAIVRWEYINRYPRGLTGDSEFWIQDFTSGTCSWLESLPPWSIFLKNVRALAEWESSDEPMGDEQSSRVEEFIRTVSSATKRKILKRDVSIVAGYKDDTMRQRFQRKAEDLTDEARKNFNRVLAMSPSAFVEALDRNSR